MDIMRLFYATVIAGIIAYASYKKVPANTMFDRALLGFALVLFAFFLFGNPVHIEEKFTTANITSTTSTQPNTTGGAEATPLATNRYIEDLEDMEKISTSLVLYTTVFSPKSTSDLLNSPGTWKNVAKTTAAKEYKFTFDSSDSKVYRNFVGETSLLIDKTLSGPRAENVLSRNEMGKFTIAIVVKHTIPSINTANKEYVLFDFPDSTSDANKAGLQISLLNFSGVTGTSTIKADFRIRYADIVYGLAAVSSETKLAIDPQQKYLYTFVIDAASYTTTSVVKMFRAILGSSQTSNVAHNLVKILPSTALSAQPSFIPSNTFITINSTPRNPTPEPTTSDITRTPFTTTLYNIAIFKTNLTETERTNLLTHMNHNINPVPKRCPYVDDICYSDECNAIDDWANPTALRDLPACRKKIDAFCTSNTSFLECKCWDPNSTEYASSKCRLWRAYIGDDASRALDIPGLTAAQITEIKNVHKLVTQTSQEQAVKEAKDAAERLRVAAVDSEKLRLVNYYENAPRPGTGMAPDPTIRTAEAANAVGPTEAEAKKLKGNGELDVVDFWAPPTGSRASKESKTSSTKTISRTNKSRPINIVNPYDPNSESVEADEDDYDETTVVVNKINRLRESEKIEEDEPKGFFAAFRRLIAG